MNFYLYRAGWFLIYPVVWIVLLWRLFNRKEKLSNLSERRGIPSLPRPKSKKLIWLHAVSVGEVKSILPLIVSVLKNSDKEDVILVTSSTVTSRAVFYNFKKGLDPSYSSRLLHQFLPYDHQFYVGRFLKHWRPDAVIWCEQDLYPNAIFMVHKYLRKHKKGEIFLVQARMSADCVRRWRRPIWQSLIKSMLNKFDKIYCQSLQDRDNFMLFTKQDLLYAGNLKYFKGKIKDGVKFIPEKFITDSGHFAWGIISAHPEDEDLILSVHNFLSSHFKVLTVIMHRHPDKAKAFYNRLKSGQENICLFSDSGQASEVSGLFLSEAKKKGGIYIFDAIGKVDYFLGSALDIFMIGGSFSADIGGHNPYEATTAGKVVVTGPNMENFQDGVDELLISKAIIKTTSKKNLQETLLSFARDSNLIADQKKKAFSWRPKGDPISDITKAFLKIEKVKR